jgi:hypothetical protein
MSKVSSVKATAQKQQDSMPEKLFRQILREDDRRLSVLMDRYNPLTGMGAPGRRFKCAIGGILGGQVLFLPIQMLRARWFRVLLKCGSVSAYVASFMAGCSPEAAAEAVVRRFCRLRCRHDFYFFAYAYARIKNKDGGKDIEFYLRPAQVKVCKVFEALRIAGLPIYVILLKCRQWGGSTLTDIYMVWIQIFWKISWNCSIVGHQSTSSITVFNMYERLINAIPLWLFYPTGKQYPDDARKLRNDSKNPNIKYLVPRACKIQTGSALNPEAARSDDVAMAHITEEAFFPMTEKWDPSKVVKSVLSPIMLKPFNFVVRESTPNGRENEFHDEWIRAKQVDDKGEKLSKFTPVFVAWFEIETYLSPFKSASERGDFLLQLYRNRFDERFNGKYYWWLWQKGATLEGIRWYVDKAKTYDAYPCLDDMQQEFPSDDIEAFKYSGKSVFDPYQIERQTPYTQEPPVFIGDIEGASTSPHMQECMDDIHLIQQGGGPLKVWDMPDGSELVSNRYLVAVDIGGSHRSSDFSVIVVFDRYDEMFGGVPAVVAEWHGHCDPDQLAMKCAQIAKFFYDAFLAVENNTAYSKMNNTDGDVSQLFFPTLIPLYDNLYNSNHNKLLKRKPKEVMWGFNTNTSTKVAIIKHLAAVLRTDGYMEREPEAINEYSYYMQYPDGHYGNVPGKHDDRVMARAIGLWVDREMDTPIIRERKTKEQVEKEKLLRAKPKAPEIIAI